VHVTEEKGVIRVGWGVHSTFKETNRFVTGGEGPGGGLGGEKVDGVAEERGVGGNPSLAEKRRPR